VSEPADLTPYYEVIDEFCDEAHAAAGMPPGLIAELSRLRLEGRSNTPG
jgi:hypothetical protein